MKNGDGVLDPRENAAERDREDQDACEPEQPMPVTVHCYLLLRHRWSGPSGRHRAEGRTRPQAGRERSVIFGASAPMRPARGRLEWDADGGCTARPDAPGRITGSDRAGPGSALTAR